MADAAESVQLRRRGAVVAALLALAVVAAAEYAVVSGTGDPVVPGGIGTVLGAGSALAALAALAAARRTVGRLALAWHLLTAAALVWAAGQLGPALGLPAHPLVAGGQLSGAALACAGLVAYPPGRLGGSRSRSFVENLLVAGSVLLVGWVAVLRTQTAGEAGNIGRLLADVALATLALVLVRRAGGPGRLPLVLLTAAIGWLCLADGGSVASIGQAGAGGRYWAAGAPAAGWLAGALLLALAATLTAPGPAAAGRPEPPTRMAGLAPYGAVVVGTGVALADVLAGDPPGWFEAALVSGLIVLLVVRQALSMLETLELGRALGRSEEHFRTLVQGSSDVITIIDTDGRISWQSEAIERLFGYPAGGLVGTNLRDLVHPSDLPAAERRLVTGVEQPLVDGARAVIVENRIRDAAGEWRYVESVFSDHLDDPAVRGIVINTRDVTERKLLEERLRQMAFCDELTGLANRTRMRERVHAALEPRDDAGSPVALLFIDLDGFKGVNDSLGHASGDQLIRDAAGRLAETVRPGDLVARLGGDEFAVLVEGTAGLRDAVDVARRLLHVLEAPYHVGNSEIVISASIGVATAAPGDDPDVLLRDADLAMYRAKATGKGHVETYVPEMYQTVLRRVELDRDLRAALDHDELDVAYQPVVDMRTGRAVAVEALLRWRSDARGEVEPLDFVPFAEESGLIVPIGRWVLDQACRQVARWRRAGVDVRLMVNVSARQLQSPRLVETVASTLRAHSLAPHLLTIELTESVLVDGADRTLAKLHLLREIGIGLAIDDFGTGWSSLSYLRRLPVDTVKVDRSFVAGLTDDADVGAVTRAIVRLVDDLGMSLVAEGVENAEQAQQLMAMGARYAQGWLFARPAPADDIGRLFAGGQPLLTPLLLRTIGAATG